jgi:hypothetical protein
LRQRHRTIRADRKAIPQKATSCCKVISALKGYAIEASDGGIGSISDFLFDDRTWKVGWLVVDTGTWLTERKVLLQPSAIAKADYEGQKLMTNLTKSQVEGSPDIRQHQPISRQMERDLYSYYGWDPLWGGDYLGGSAGAMAAPLATEPYFGIGSAREAADIDAAPLEEDSHLRSFGEVSGYHIEAADGELGHVQDFVLESASWEIRYLILDTSNWWLGQHVLMSPHAIKQLDWSEHRVQLNVTREQVKASPAWDPIKLMDQDYMKQLHGHYGWPGSAA